MYAAVMLQCVRGRWFPTLVGFLLVLSSVNGGDLVPLNADWRFVRGFSEASPSNPSVWRHTDFDDSSWELLPAPFWYGDAQPEPGTELFDMSGNYTSVFLRRTFNVVNAGAVEFMELGAQSDDGFIAWLNGVEIARFNMPLGEIAYDGTSLDPLPEPIPFQTIGIPNPAALLNEGLNVLAVHAFNSSPGFSSDFVINVSLTADADVLPPEVEAVFPGAGQIVAALTQIEVVFSEPVAGVDAGDLRINGVPATNVVALTGANQLFLFPQPAPGTITISWNPSHGITDLAAVPNPFTGAGWGYTLDPDYLPAGLQISEFMAANNHTIEDSFGDNSDWIEIFNGGSEPINLLGWRLTDSVADLAKWTFPDLTLGQGQYLLVFASDRNLTSPAAELHTNFRLSRDSGYLALVSPSGQIASVFSSYPPQETDVSYGRDLVDPQMVGYFVAPTPGWPNTTAGDGFASGVRFSVASGSFAQPFSLVITPEHPAANLQIRYTLDGSPVHEGSLLYTAPISITGTTRVRARAFQPGLWPGPQAEEVYFGLTAQAAGFVTDLPIIVLHNEGGGEVPSFWDQPVLVQAYEPIDGVTSLTNRPTLSSHGIFHLRGSSTLFYPKGSFFLETQDELGFDQAVSLLGLPNESDWVLYAPNNFEPVLIHNPVAMELSRQMGQYASRTRFVVVFLNTAGGSIDTANYNGIYVLEEKIKADPERVAIDRLGPQDLQPPEVTGGYLLSVDRPAPDEWQIWAGDQSLNVLDPDFWEFMSPQRAAQYNYLQNYLDSFYSALVGPDWQDPVIGYAAYIDLPAAIDHHIHGVVTFNVDALRLSGYLYKPRDGKIVMGPVWDFDRTQGSTDGRDFNPRLWRSRVGDQGTDMFNASGTYHNPWYGRMFQDIDFWQRWVDRYQELRDASLATPQVHAVIDALAGQVRNEHPREVLRWGVRPRNGVVTIDGYSRSFSGSYQGEVDWMKDWYTERLSFIDQNLLARPLLSLASGPVVQGTVLTLSNAEPGTIYYTLDGTDPRLPGGQVAGTAQVYGGPITISANSRVSARTRNLQHRNLTGPGAPPLSTPWSGLAAATYVVETPSLIISEIMYHPGTRLADGGYEDNDFEFVELLNRGSQPLNLAGFHFTNGINFAFSGSAPIAVLAPGERVVVVKNLAAFQARYPNVNRVAGVYTGSLDNAGERIALAGPLQEPILDFEYNNAWYRTTDGLGFSLVLRTEAAALEDFAAGASWRVSSLWGGSPGTAEPPPPSIPVVLITEALTHTDPPDQDMVELHNPGPAAADIGGWWISDDLEEPFKFQIPATTAIPIGGYVVFNESQFTNAAISFRLSSLGDAVYVFSASNGTNLTGYLHGFEYGAAFNGVSFGRHVLTTGDENFVAQTAPSLGASNPGSKVGPVVINEIMANPEQVSGPGNAALDEYLELHNLSANVVPLYDPLAPTNTWRIRGGIDFDFPPNVTMPPNSYLLVVSFDPQLDPGRLAAFRSHYSLSPATAVVGPFLGRLDNEGDNLRLLEPDQPQGPESPEPGLVPYVLVEAVDYEVGEPWPDGPSTSPKSIQRRNPAWFGNDPAHWESAAPTPGLVNPSTGSPDSDSDTLPDVWEIAYELDPLDSSDDNGQFGDPDADELANREEMLAGTHPRMADTDGDGLTDAWEVQYSLNPLNGSGLHSAAGDPDGDGLSNVAEQTHGTHPLKWDSDDDLLGDAWEISNNLDPNNGTGDHGTLGDPDQDGLSNYHEFLAGTDPWDSTSGLRLRLERLADGRLSIRFSTIAGRAYLLQTRTNLAASPWTTLMEVAPLAQDSEFQLLGGVQNIEARFYRVMLRP
jgi:hypothetical protein